MCVIDVITSTSNPRVRAAAALARRRERVSAGRYLLEGPNAVADAHADGGVVELFVSEDEADAWAGIDLPVTVVAEHVLRKIATATSPQGVIGIGRIDAASLEQLSNDGLVLGCHEVNDPGNAGTVVRIGDAVDAAGVVLGEGSVDPWNPKAVRAAAGSVTHLPLVVDATTEQLVAWGSARGRTVALDGGGDVDIEDVPVDQPMVLLAGSESHGLPPQVLDTCDIVASLPIWGRSESLNLGAAVAIGAYSLTRRSRA